MNIRITYSLLLLLSLLHLVSGQDVPIVDTHVHLTNLSILDYIWKDQVPSIYKTWTLENYTQAFGNTSIFPDRIVFVEVNVIPGDYVKEVRYIQSLADAPRKPGQPQIAGIVGYAPLENSAAVASMLDEMRGISPLLRGIRRRLLEDVAPNCNAMHGNFTRGVGLLGTRGLHFEIIASNPDSLACAAILPRTYPQMRFIIDHMGSPNISGSQGMDLSWLRSMRALAEFRNVVVKFSGMASEAIYNNTFDDWTVEEITPYFEQVLQLFGPERMLFGGNWFFENLATYPYEWIAAVRRLIRNLSPQQQQAILGGNAMTFYRLR